MKKRIYVLLFCMIFGLLALIGRILYISQFQITTDTASLKSSRTEVFGTDRGLIFDRNNKKITENEFNIVSPAFSDNIRLKEYKRYSDNQLCAQIIGYTNVDNLGVSGIEKDYNDFLMSIENRITVKFSVDANGRVLKGKKTKIDDTQTCENSGVVLTIDRDIQSATEKYGKSLEKGSVTVLDSDSGDILAMASFPSFNPNKVADYTNDDDMPFLNRALNNYNVGSIFKAVVCMAALENGISEDYSYVCTGSENCGGVNFNCHELDGHGKLNMKGAVAHSCNTYFINLAQKVGYEKILEMCRKLGIEESIKLSDSIISSAGNLPSKKVLSSPAGLANFSFGQGELLASPLEFCRIYAVIANGGFLVKPRLIIGKLEDGKLTAENQFLRQNIRVISKETANKIKEFMEYTVTDGTGKSAKMNCTVAGGKTATAQTGKYFDGIEKLISYFIGFYTTNGKTYTIIVSKEGGKSGSKDCSPVFKNISEYICGNYDKNRG